MSKREAGASSAHFAGFVLVALSLAEPGWADEVIADDLIVQGSACIGLDCENNEIFSFDTLILKENNLQILFDDSSAIAGYPTNDWRIVINDRANGGSSYFAIQDATAGQTLFRLCAVASTGCTNIVPTASDPQTALNTSAIAQNTTDIAQNTADIAQNTADIAALSTQINGFAEEVSANRDGVAMAIALGGVAPLMPDQNGTLAVNVGLFNGASALGLAGGFRLNDAAVMNVGLGYAAGSETYGGRVGVQFSW